MRRWRPWLRIAVVLIVIALGGAFLFGWSGLYNVAASRGHLAITEWVLAFVMENSVESRAPFSSDPPPLDDPALIRLGAAHFQIECAGCHGAPGISANPVMQAALPPAPELAAVDARWDDKELFWIVQHGIKYTGMPAWPSQQRDDEVWAVVAFLRALGGLDAAAYRALAFNAAAEEEARRRIASGQLPDIAQNCLRCHGDGSTPPLSPLVPSLHGQTSDFLVAALRAYADGTRPSGIMQPMAAALAEEDRQRLAAFYAGLERPQRPPAAATTGTGRTIATEGMPDREIPACLSCHSHDANPAFPRLAGQSEAYLAGQLRLWKAGANSTTPGAAIMAPIAQRLNDAEIAAVSAYLAELQDDASLGASP